MARGGMWIFVTRAVSEGLRFARLLVLARLLAPNDFGLMGIALLVIASLQSFTQSGFRQALIQKQGNINEYLDTAWTVSGLRGLVLCVSLVALSPYVAGFFNEPAATPIVRVVALSLCFMGWSNIGTMYFDKELEFNKQFIFEVGGAVVDLIVAITAVLILGSVWALVFGLLAGTLTRFILSYILHPYRPHLRFDKTKAKELFSFGQWIWASSIILFLLTQGDDIVVGKLLAASALGLYQMAYRISNLPATEITRVITQVTFPAYSKLQDNLPKLQEAYLKTLRLTAFVVFPVAGGIFVIAPEFTEAFLGSKWMPMVPAIQMLTLFGLIRSLSGTVGPLFQGLAKVRFRAAIQFAQLCIMAALIYPLTKAFGILGASIAVTIPPFVLMWIGWRECAVSLKLSLVSIIRVWLAPLIISAIMVGILIPVRLALLDGNEPIIRFIILVPLGVLIYGVLAYLFQADSVKLLKSTFRTVFI